MGHQEPPSLAFESPLEILLKIAQILRNAWGVSKMQILA